LDAPSPADLSASASATDLDGHRQDITEHRLDRPTGDVFCRLASDDKLPSSCRGAFETTPRVAL
jgi:hypothetical protein